MDIISAVSDGCIPAIIFLVVINGFSKKQNVYGDFISGAKSGINTVLDICPTLIGLMLGVRVLAASGFMDAMAALLSPVAKIVGYPVRLIPFAVVKMFSSSASTALFLNVLETEGADSLNARIAAIQLGSTETIFYTISVYFMATACDGHKGVTKTGYTVAGALFATAAGIIMSVLTAKLGFS